MKQISTIALVLIILFFFSRTLALAASINTLQRNFASDSADMVFNELTDEEPKFSLDVLNVFAYASDQIKIISTLRLVGIIQAYGINQNAYLIASFINNGEWLDKMVESGELTPTYARVLTFFAGKTSNCMNESQKGICYSSNGDRAVLLAKLSYGPTNRKCSTGSAFYLWDSKKGGSTVCLATRTI